MNTNIRSRTDGVDGHRESEQGWAGELRQIDMYRADLNDADSHRNRVPPGIAWFDRRCGALSVRDGTVVAMAVFGAGMLMTEVRGALVLMDRGTMVMARMIVATVLVDVQ